MDLKVKYDQIKADINAALKAAEAFIGEGKFDEAKTKQDEAKSLGEQLKIVKAQLDAQAAQAADEAAAKAAKLEAENAQLRAQAKTPTRLEDLGEQTPAEDATEKAVYVMKYGDLDKGVKAVIGDLYGSDFRYNEAREHQMAAFVKYLRFGQERLSGAESALLDPKNVKNFLLRPEVIGYEIKSGRTVGEIKATLVEGSLDLGGYLVPEDYRTEIIKRLAGATIVRGRARVVTTVRDAVEWPRLEGGNDQHTSAVRVTWVEENPANASVAETNPTFGMLRIPVHTVMARTDLSRNLLEDSAFNLLDILADLFAEEMSTDEDEQFLTGVGGGRPYGILGDRSGAEAVPVTGIAVANSGNATTLTGDGIIDLVESLADQYKGMAVLAMRRSARQIVRKLKDGDGRYLWQNSFQQGVPPTLVGYPVLSSELLPAVSANSHPVIFGDFKGYIIADRVGMTVERITDATLMGQNKIAIFARRRLGGQAVEPWRFAAQKVSA